MNKNYFISIAALGIIWVCYTSCSDRAEFSYNSNRSQTVENTTTAGNPMVTNKLIGSICSTITRCFNDVTASECEQGVSSTVGFASPLGVASSFDTLASIESAEYSGALTGNSTAADSCSSQIQNLTCSDPSITASYNPLSTNPFINSPKIIPQASSCNLSYSPQGPIFLQLQTASLTSASTSLSTPSFANPVSTGNFMICVALYNSPTRDLSSISDTSGNSYIRGDAAAGTTGTLNGWTADVWYAYNIVGAANLSITATFNSPMVADLVCHEYSGLGPANPGDTSSGRTGFGSDAQSPSPLTSQAKELIFGVGVFGAPGATAGPGFTQRSSYRSIVTADMVVNTIDNFSSRFINPPTDYIVQVLTYKAQ